MVARSHHHHYPLRHVTRLYALLFIILPFHHHYRDRGLCHAAPLETPDEPMGLDQAKGVFEYDPGEQYGLNETSQLSQTTILTTIRGAEQGNKGQICS